MRRSARTSFTLLLAGLLAGGCGEDAEPAPLDASGPDDAGIEDARLADGGRDAGSSIGATRSLAVSPTHKCALRASGVYCWGDNFAGQLGRDGEDSETPSRVEGAGDDIVELAASSGRSCLRRSTGEVACWGANGYGQLGDGTREDSASPRAALGIDDGLQLAIDETTSCVLRARGEVACWGGVWSASTEDGWLVPFTVAGLEGAIELRGGVLDRYCARGDEGWVRCFSLENGVLTEPVDVPALEGAAAIAVPSNEEVCAITEARDIVCHNTRSGRTLTLVESERSVELVGSSLVVCAIDEDGAARCWNILTPLLDASGSMVIDVPAEQPVLELAPAGFAACVLYEDQSVACAFANDDPVVAVPVELPE